MKKLFLILFLLPTLSFSQDKVEFFKPVIEQLLNRGVDSTFIYNLVNHQSVNFNEKYVKINVTGYLKKADYSQNYSDYSVSRSIKFLNEYSPILEKAELEYNVPKEVITSILWVETRTGEYLGSNHIPSVFLSTAMANQQEYIDMNIEVYKESFEEDSEAYQNYVNKVIYRANKKSNWALNELEALARIDKFLPISIFDLKGSWAGAFGLSQFLPSSYSKWAVDGDGNGKVDLFNVTDAIFSVANYLSTNGWGADKEQQRSAVFHYNNSNDYVDAVLILADKITTN